MWFANSNAWNNDFKYYDPVNKVHMPAGMLYKEEEKSMKASSAPTVKVPMGKLSGSDETHDRD